MCCQILKSVLALTHLQPIFSTPARVNYAALVVVFVVITVYYWSTSRYHQSVIGFLDVFKYSASVMHLFSSNCFLYGSAQPHAALQ